MTGSPASLVAWKRVPMVGDGRNKLWHQRHVEETHDPASLDVFELMIAQSIDLEGALARTISLATNGERPLQHTGPSVRELTLVAGAGNHREFEISTPI
jgi:hypothetical protein